MQTLSVEVVDRRRRNSKWGGGGSGGRGGLNVKGWVGGKRRMIDGVGQGEEQDYT